MARKKHLINVHTSTGTTAPVSANLRLGEIAVQHTDNEAALWIKMGSGETSTEYEKFIGETEINNLLSGSTVFVKGDGEFSALQVSSNGTAFGNNSVLEGISTTNAIERGITSASTAEAIIAEWSASTPESDKFSLTKGEASHAEGNNNLALGNHSHVEGNGCIAGNNSAHAEGTGSKATNKYAHAEGLESIASGLQSHAEGHSTEAAGSSSHAEGNATKASSSDAHAEGRNTLAGTGNRPAADADTAAGKYTHAEGNGTQAYGNSSHAEGRYTLASGESSHVEGRENVASGNRSHAEGMGTQAKGNQSHAEGNDTTANAWASHTEGYNTETGGNYSANTKTADTDDNNGDTAHAEGNATIAKGPASHSEGKKTFAAGFYSHAEGDSTTARGLSSHAEGAGTIASGLFSHAEGWRTETKNQSEHTEGQYNSTHSGSTSFGSSANTTHSVGIGTGDNRRKNAFEIMQNGDAYLIGVGGYSGTSIGNGILTLQEILNSIPDNTLGSGYTYSGIPYVNSSTTIADAYSALTNEVLENELVTAAGLIDLSDKIDELSATTQDIHVDMILGSGYTYSGLPYVNSSTTIADAYSALTNEMFKDEKTVSAVINDINRRIDENAESISGTVISIGASISGTVVNLSAATVSISGDVAGVNVRIDDLEEVTAHALNDLDGRVANLGASTVSISGDVAGVNVRIDDLEEVTAHALNDLDERVGVLERKDGAKIVEYGASLDYAPTEAFCHIMESDLPRYYINHHMDYVPANICLSIQSFSESDNISVYSGVYTFSDYDINDEVIGTHTYVIWAEYNDGNWTHDSYEVWEPDIATLAEIDALFDGGGGGGSGSYTSN